MSSQAFFLHQDLAVAPPPPPMAMLANPFAGATVSKQSINAKQYIDVTYTLPGNGTLQGINGDEFRIVGAGAANVALTTAADSRGAGFVGGSPLKLNATTYRYFLTPKTGVETSELFVNGEVEIQFQAGKWSFSPSDGGAAVNSVRGTAFFTVDSTTQDAAAATNAINLGPISLEGPSVGIAGLGFEDGMLVVTIGIGVDTARLAFGGNGNGTSAQQSDSGITAQLTGVLGKLDIAVDVLGLISGESESDLPISPTGKFSLDIATLEINVPNVVRVTGAGISLAYDPNYDPAENNGEAQRLLVVNNATISFDKFGISGSIAPFTPEGGADPIPGLMVWTDGFALGTAQLVFGRPVPDTQGASQATQTTPGAAIKIGSILEFDDIRIGVSNFEVRFGQAIDFDGEIFIATGGAKFFPGKPFSATLSDRTGVEEGDLPGQPETEAARATLEFEDGKVKAFRFEVDTFQITLGSFVTLTGRGFMLDTGASASEELVAFEAVGAEVKIGSLLLSGEGRNFAFLGDGTFVTKPGFGVFVGVGSATGSSFKWPSWMPIRLTEIGIEWPDIQADPSDFTLILSATVEAIDGMPGMQFAGTVQGIRIDIGLLLEGKFPIVGIDSLGVSISGSLFGGELTAALIGGILKVDAGGNMIGTFDRTTPVADRIFFVGIEGGFAFPGVGGLTIRLAISELGPLGVFLSASVPGGIVLEPNTGLAINDFSAGVEFFKSLPSIEDPFELRNPAFDIPSTTSPDLWLAGVQQQVVTQYQAIKANPALGAAGFLAAFTSPMIITGGAKVFSIYTSKELFNGEVVVRFSTDGKFLVVGKLNFLADNISISGKLYADLSRVASGDVVVLFLADVPDQVRLLTIYGKLKMGFRNAAGEEVEFTVVDPEARPTPTSSSPARRTAARSAQPHSTATATSTSRSRRSTGTSSTPSRSPTWPTSSRWTSPQTPRCASHRVRRPCTWAARPSATGPRVTW